MIFNIDKAQNKALRWVMKAVSKLEDRPVLQAVHSNGAVIGCDGFRIHAVNMQGIDQGTWVMGQVPARAEVVQAEEFTGSGYYSKYPDIQVVMPVDEPAVEVCVSAKYLKEAVEAMNQGAFAFVRMRVYGKDRPVEILGELADGVNGYALIMPVVQGVGYYGNNETKHTWRPGKREG